MNFPLVLPSHPGCLDVPQTDEQTLNLRAFALTVPLPSGVLVSIYQMVLWGKRFLEQLLTSVYKCSPEVWLQTRELRAVRTRASQCQHGFASACTSFPTYDLLAGCLTSFMSHLQSRLSRDGFSNPHIHTSSALSLFILLILHYFHSIHHKLAYLFIVSLSPWECKFHGQVLLCSMLHL